MEEAIDRIKGLLEWSDRLGSDERNELEVILELLEKDK